MSSIILPVFPLDNALAVDIPFVDWFSFTVPVDEAELLVSKFDSIFALFGATRDEQNLYRFPTPTGYGTCKIDAHSAFYVFSMSGRALQHLRLFDFMDFILGSIAQVTHKITRLDVACDFNIDSHIAIKELAEQAQACAVQLTRKFITPSQIKKILSFDRYGQETGTLYLGHRASSDVCCRVYDKAHELHQSHGLEIPPRLRIEFTFKGLTLPSLRDVDMPSSIFYHHALHSLVKPPSTHKPWVSYGEPYQIKKMPKNTAYARMMGIFNFSSDIEKIVEYAIEEFGETAHYHLSKLFKNRVKKSLRGMGWNPMQASLF